jgi:apolipoprotein N-acyltransferase
MQNGGGVEEWCGWVAAWVVESEAFARAGRYVMAFVGLYVLFFYVIGPTLRRRLWRPSRARLAGKVAIVTGASRGSLPPSIFTFHLLSISKKKPIFKRRNY